MESFENSEKLKKYTNNKLTIEDFTIIKVVGKGSYGKVLLVKKNNEENFNGKKESSRSYKNRKKNIRINRSSFYKQIKICFSNRTKIIFSNRLLSWR